MVKEPTVAEKIATLLDGMADEERREALLAELATADEGYELFVDTAGVLREIEEEEAAVAPEVRGAEDVVAPVTLDAETAAAPEAPVVPALEEPAAPTVLETDEVAAEPAADEPAPRRGPVLVEAEAPALSAEREPETPAGVILLRPRPVLWQRPGVRWLAAAAVVAVVTVPVIRNATGARAWRDPQHLAALTRGGPPPDWQHTWTVLRGAGGGEENTALAARVGTLHMDLVATVGAPGTLGASRVDQLAGTIADELDASSSAGLSYLARAYQDIADSSRVWRRDELQERLGEAQRSAAEATDPDYFALGAWTEAARLAASRRDAAFFRASESRRALERAATLEALGPEAVDAAKRLSRLKDQSEVQNWTPVSKDLDLLQRQLSR